MESKLPSRSSLATGRRASEVLNFLGILGDVATERDGSISLCFLPEFIAKNQNPGQMSPSVSVRPLTHLLDSGEPETVYCPVRALKLYRRRARNIRSSQRKLFISYNEAYSKDISATSLSRWFKSLIIGAYKRFEGTSVFQGCQVFRFARILFLVSSTESETTGLSLMSRIQAFKQKKWLENRSIGSKVM